MRLSILMPALEKRSERCVIRDQINAQIVPGVEFLEIVDNGEMTSGLKRQRLAEMSTGDYIAFVDDDDLVSLDYVQSLLDAIESNPDVVTFDVQAEFSYIRKTEKEVWHFGLHEDNRDARRMCANHLSAWKRSIATSVAWCPALGCGDDQLWYKPILMAGLPKTEVHIDRILYHYLWDIRNTSNQTQQRVNAAKQYFGKGLKCLIDDAGEIFIQNGYSHPSRPVLYMRNRNNDIIKVRRGHLRELGVVKFR